MGRNRRHGPKIDARFSDASFSCRCTTSNVVDCLRLPTLEVVHRHEKLAPESGVEFMATVSGACVSFMSYTLAILF